MTGRALALALAAALAGAGVCSAADGQPISFVTCPIARDTGPDTDICFIAEYAGRRYALVNPTDFGQPQLKHRVLVEGLVTDDAPSVCGATPIEGRVSVIWELAPECDQILPFDASFKGVASGVFNSGPPEQRQRARELAARAERDPMLSIEPAQPETASPTAPPPPYTTQSLTVFFPFDSDRGSGPDMASVWRLAELAKASRGRVEVIGTRGASRLSNGEVMTERPGMARRRAEKLVEVLEGLGVERGAVRATWNEAPPPAAGVGDWRSRRIELTVRPAAS